MNRRKFIKNTSVLTAGAMFVNPANNLAGFYAPNSRKKVAVVGTGVRCIFMFGRDMLQDYSQYIDLVGLCDINPGRLAFAKNFIGTNCNTYTDLDEMVRREKPETLIVTTEDSAHHEVIIRGMELGCDIITEKPLTIDEGKAQAILDAEKRTGKNIIVTFNYRYPPYRAKIKELLMSGLVGDVLSADFHWNLDHSHLTRYFQRWHGESNRGGTLWVHKSTHHFDMINWWLNSDPEEVFAYGSNERYGINGSFRGKNCRNCAHTAKCPYFWDITKSQIDTGLYTDNEHYDGYVRDNCVFRPQIDIYEKHAAVVKYANGAMLNYSLNGDSDHDGYWLAFNGTKGRLELRMGGYSYGEDVDIVFLPNGRFTDEKAQVIKAYHSEGGHWGGDPLMMDKLFKDPNMPDPLGQQAGTRDGVMSILIGIAARKSVQQNKPIRIEGLTSLKPQAKRPA
jgi:predicted dehydrogenase